MVTTAWRKHSGYEDAIDSKRIALYADYNVDGTMSCVSWIWVLKLLVMRIFIHYMQIDSLKVTEWIWTR